MCGTRGAPDRGIAELENRRSASRSLTQSGDVTNTTPAGGRIRIGSPAAPVTRGSGSPCPHHRALRETRTPMAGPGAPLLAPKSMSPSWCGNVNASESYQARWEPAAYGLAEERSPICRGDPDHLDDTPLAPSGSSVAICVRRNIRDDRLHVGSGRYWSGGRGGPDAVHLDVTCRPTARAGTAPGSSRQARRK